MNPNTIQHRHIRRIALAATAVAAALTVYVPTTTAGARQDPGPPPNRTIEVGESMPFRCPVERIGSQIVRCDNLSGDGVPAPLGIPQQR